MGDPFPFREEHRAENQLIIICKALRQTFKHLNRVTIVMPYYNVK